MHSRQVIQALFLMAGIAILALLFVPAVHVPFIVVHGPMSALRAQRAAWMFQLLIQTSALSVAGFYIPVRALIRHSQNEPSLTSSKCSWNLICALRC